MEIGRDSAMREYFDWCLKNMMTKGTDDDLWYFIKLFMGFEIPRIRVCENHVSPFEFVADTFFERENNALVIANRNGGKTQNFGIKNDLDMIFKHCEIASVGAVLAQADKCYSYSKAILENKWFRERLINSIQKSTKAYNIYGGASELQILPGTPAGVNSPHPQKTNLDEVELMKWAVLQEAMSMPKSNNYAKASLCITSSLKYGHGCMVRLMDAREENGLNLYTWCIYETIENCPDGRSGTIPVNLIFRQPGEKELCMKTVYTKDPNLEGKTLDYLTSVKKREEKHSGCLSCKLVTSCWGKAKKAHGYYSIDDTIVKFQNLDEDTWVSQWESKRPGTKGRIYPMFSEQNNMYKGEYHYNPNYPSFLGIDLGFTNPAVILAGQELPDGKVVLMDEFYKEGLTSPEFIETAVIPFIKKYNTEKVYIDPSGADEISQLQKKGYGKIVMAADNDVDSGIRTVRAFISNALQDPRLYYVKSRMPNFHREMTYYHNVEESDKVDKVDDHTCDACRYMLHTRFPMVKKAKFKASSN